MAETQRVFVGNLPHEASSEEVSEKFKKYCSVDSVELKTKTDPLSGQPIATFAFVNLCIDKASLHRCIQLVNGIKWGEHNIKVEAAKESFLQRLQKERQLAKSSEHPPKVHSSPCDPNEASSVSDRDNIALSISKREKGPENVKEQKKKLSKKKSWIEGDDEEPNGTLPKFKGIASIELEKLDQSNKKSKQSRSENETAKLKTRNQTSVMEDDILKKFESFSDVWKDEGDDFQTEKQFEFKKHSQDRRLRNNALSNNAKVPNESHEPVKDIKKSQGKQLEIVDKISNTLSANTAEEKRLKSLEARRQAFELQKKAVQLALSDKGVSRVNKKIFFDDDNREKESGVNKNLFKNQEVKGSQGNVKNQQKALNLFDDSDGEAVDDNWDADFQLKKQFEGIKGKKLLELQGKFNNDQRFKLDERFYDGEEKSKIGSTEKDPSNFGEECKESLEAIAEERQQQLQILSSILGQPVPDSSHASQKESKSKGMLRFDPLKPNHSRFELSKDPKQNRKRIKSKLRGGDMQEGPPAEDEEELEEVNPKVRREEKPPEPVSQSKFYSISENLGETLKRSKEGQGTGFSLLKMFGTPDIPQETKEKYSVGLIEKKQSKKTLAFNDSSEDEESDIEGPTAKVDNAIGSSSVLANGFRPATWKESFFLQPEDSRLKEGAEFFTQLESPSDYSDFIKKREFLRRIAKQKREMNLEKEKSFKQKIGSVRKKTLLWSKSSNSGPGARRRRRH